MHLLSYSTLALLGFVLIGSMIPGFYILAFYQNFVCLTPDEWTITSTIYYIIKAFNSTLALLVALFIYSDAVFPFIMYSFSKIFLRLSKSL